MNKNAIIFMVGYVFTCLFVPHEAIKPHVFDVNVSMNSPLVAVNNKEVNIYN